MTNLIEKTIGMSYRVISTLVLAGSVAYCVAGEMKGISDTINKQSTFHVSSDIYLGHKEPTKLETKFMNCSFLKKLK
jgi:hypothetical protein